MTPTQLQIQVQKLDEQIDNKILSESGDIRPIFDGIIDTAKYLLAPLKILWILKEPYDEFEDGKPYGGGWDLKAVIRQKNSIYDFARSRATFRPMTYVAWGIFNNFCLWNDMNDVEKDPSMLNALKSIAYINIKKLPGLTSTHYSVCRDAYNLYKDLLLQQINLINPDIVIGGSTMHFFKADLGLPPFVIQQNSSCHYIKHNNKLYIDAYHPAQRSITEEKYCDDIILATKNLQKSK